jgi:hypothetical protein
MTAMKQTPEMIEAQEAVNAAIERLTRACDYHDQNEVNGNWVIVVAQSCIDEEGDIGYSYVTLFKNGHIAITEAVGLLETAAFNMKMGRSGE